MKKTKRLPPWKPSATVAVVPMPDGTGRCLCQRHWMARLEAGEPLPRSCAAAREGAACEDCAQTPLEN